MWKSPNIAPGSRQNFVTAYGPHTQHSEPISVVRHSLILLFVRFQRIRWRDVKIEAMECSLINQKCNRPSQRIDRSKRSSTQGARNRVNPFHLMIARYFEEFFTNLDTNDNRRKTTPPSSVSLLVDTPWKNVRCADVRENPESEEVGPVDKLAACSLASGGGFGPLVDTTAHVQ